MSQGPASPLLTWHVTQQKMPWNIVLLLGGGFALAKGSEVCTLFLFPVGGPDTGGPLTDKL